MTNSIDDRIKIKAEITNFNMRYYVYVYNKVAVALALASCDHQKCKLRMVAELQVGQLNIGLKSCFGNNYNKVLEGKAQAIAWDAGGSLLT